MSWEFHKKDIEGVRKVKWDGLWHVLYKLNNRDTYDRINRTTALHIEENMNKWRYLKIST